MLLSFTRTLCRLVLAAMFAISCLTTARADGIDLGYGPDLFYTLRHDASNQFSTFGTLSTSGATMDRFGVGNQFVALTYSAEDLGYGPNLFYYLRRDDTGFTTFGTLSTNGQTIDRFGVGMNFNALAFVATDLGYGANLFYFLRHDSDGFSTFGTISTRGEILDRFGVGMHFDALTFVSPNLGYGPELFYFLRHDDGGFSTFGTFSTRGEILDRFGVGMNFHALTFASSHLGYGPELFYFLRHDNDGFTTFGTLSTRGEILDRFGVGMHHDALFFPHAIRGAVTTQLLKNPGFESGATGWQATPSVIDSSSTHAAHGGTWKAWLNGYGTAHTDSVAQTVTIPSQAKAATLSFWLRVNTAETTTSRAYDRLSVQIKNAAGQLLGTLASFSNLDRTSSYAKKTFDLTAYQGQTVQVVLTGVEDASLQTSFLVDDFALDVTTASQ